MTEIRGALTVGGLREMVRVANLLDVEESEPVYLQFQPVDGKGNRYGPPMNSYPANTELTILVRG